MMGKFSRAEWNMSPYYVYILICTDQGSGKKSLYTGFTGDLAKRIEEHRSGKGAKYTKGRKIRLAYFETFEDRGDAIRREMAIKKLSAKQKKNLIVSFGLRNKEKIAYSESNSNTGQDLANSPFNDER